MPYAFWTVSRHSLKSDVRPKKKSNVTEATVLTVEEEDMETGSEWVAPVWLNYSRRLYGVLGSSWNWIHPLMIIFVARRNQKICHRDSFGSDVFSGRSSVGTKIESPSLSLTWWRVKDSLIVLLITVRSRVGVFWNKSRETIMWKGSPIYNFSFSITGGGIPELASRWLHN